MTAKPSRSPQRRPFSGWLSRRAGWELWGLVVLALLVLGGLGACSRSGDVWSAPVEVTEVAAEVDVEDAQGAEVSVTPATKEESAAPSDEYRRPPAAELRRRLSPLAYEVTQRGATEPPFQNAFWDHHEAGLYVDVVSGEPLFSSRDKFDSGTGWPSFTRPVDPGRVRTLPDTSHGMQRTEVRSAAGDSHLGHVFEDGPAPSGLRYCVNSAALRFIPLERLEAEGYGRYVSAVGGEGSREDRAAASFGPSAQENSCVAPSAAPGAATPGCTTTLETALLAGGCFWGMQEILRAVPGVLETEVGYIGGKTRKPTYEDVKTGRTGHAEAVRVVFDPAQISYAELLEKWFFRMHDPTTKDRQGNDVGTQYRSAIFTTSAEQARIARETKARVDRSGKWAAPLVTEIVPAGPFTPAEDDHQDYLQKNPGGYSCHFLRD